MFGTKNALDVRTHFRNYQTSKT